MPLDSLYASLEKPRTQAAAAVAPGAGRRVRSRRAIRGRRRRGRSPSCCSRSCTSAGELAPLGDDERSSSPDSPQLLLEQLDVFRRAFAHFIAAYGSYAPLPFAIQTAEHVVRQLGAADVDVPYEVLHAPPEGALVQAS